MIVQFTTIGIGQGTPVLLIHRPAPAPYRLSYAVTDPPTHRVEGHEAPFDLALELIHSLGSDESRDGPEILPDGVAVVFKSAAIQSQDTVRNQEAENFTRLRYIRKCSGWASSLKRDVLARFDSDKFNSDLMIDNTKGKKMEPLLFT